MKVARNHFRLSRIQPRPASADSLTKRCIDMFEAFEPEV